MIVNIYKKKGDAANCNKSRGISLLSTSGKVLARVLLTRVIKYISGEVLPETQCGFRKERGTADLIFVARQLQEKYREQHRDMFVAFIDLAKAFNIVNRPLLWDLFVRYGCPPKFFDVLKALHKGAKARVLCGGGKFELFPVSASARQGCVLAPVVFNIFMSAVTDIVYAGVDRDDCFALNYRVDGSVFNLRRLRARTKISTTTLFDLQYADDAAVVGVSRDELQRSLSVAANTYSRAGLVISTSKTEVLSQRRGEASHR